MKNLINHPLAFHVICIAMLLVFLAFWTSCSSKYKAVYKAHPPIIDRPNYAIFEEVIDGHEYLILDGSYSGGIVHKTTCPNHE